MTQETKHTPTPYGKATVTDGTIYIEANDRPIASICRKNDEARATGNFIVRACNAHEELVDTLTYALKHLRVAGASKPAHPYHVAYIEGVAALAKARGEA